MLRFCGASLLQSDFFLLQYVLVGLGCLAADCEGDGVFSRNHSFLLAGCGCNTGPRSRASHGSDGCALSSTCDCADDRTGGRASADLGYVAFGVAFTGYAIRAAGNRYRATVRSNGSETDRQLAGSVQPSAGFGNAYLAANRATCRCNCFSADNQVPCQRSFKSLPGVGCAGTKSRADADGHGSSSWNVLGYGEYRRQQ